MATRQFVNGSFYLRFCMILGTYGTAEGKKNQNSDFWENQIVLLLSFRKGLAFKKLYHKASLTL